MKFMRIVAIAGLFLIIYNAISVMPELAQAQVVVDLKKDAGAIGDGESNDRSALTRALNKLTSSGGGDLTVPPGHYLNVW